MSAKSFAARSILPPSRKRKDQKISAPRVPISFKRAEFGFHQHGLNFQLSDPDSVNKERFSLCNLVHGRRSRLLSSSSRLEGRVLKILYRERGERETRVRWLDPIHGELPRCEDQGRVSLPQHSRFGLHVFRKSIICLI